MAPVEPEPANRTTWSFAVAPTDSRMIRRASSRKRVVWRPVPDDSVWVLPYSGRTASRMKSSMKPATGPRRCSRRRSPGAGRTARRRPRRHR